MTATYIAREVHTPLGRKTVIDLRTEARGDVLVAEFHGPQGIPLYGMFLHGVATSGGRVINEAGTVLVGHLGEMVQ